MEKRSGGCACGAIRFEVNAPLLGTGICHCTACQKASGGPPNYVALAPTDAFEVTQGQPKLYTSKGDSGADAVRVFCPDCGSPLWSVPPGAPFVPVKLGAFDDHADLMPGMHMYTASAPPWHLTHDGLPTFEKMSPMP